MLNKDVAAVIGLVAAIAILGGAFTHTLYQFTFFLQENESLKERNELLENQNKQLQATIQKLESEVSKSISNQKVHLGDSGKVIVSGTINAITEEKNVVIRNDDDLLELWKEMNTQEPLPNVNFGSNIVIGVFFGKKPNLCYGINVDSIEQYPAIGGTVQAVVNISKTIPGDDTQCRERIINPFHLVQVPFIPDEVTFKEEQKILN